MPSLLPGYEYDIFISYRHNDNRSGWVTDFVNHLKEELAATIKEPVSVYYDSNPHDGLLEIHHVDKSLEGKLRCFIFIPIISHTYCDTKSFAWNNEFLAFCKLAKQDALGLHVKLPNRNVTSRILPVQIHDLDPSDQLLFEREAESPLRAIEFIFRSPGVNRPLTPQDTRLDNTNRTFYRDQINKIANAINHLFLAVNQQPKAEIKVELQQTLDSDPKPEGISWLWSEVRRRNVGRAALTYTIVALVLHQFLIFIAPFIKLESRFVELVGWMLLGGFPLATLFAWFYEVSPHGLIRTNSPQATENPFPPERKKPFTGRPLILLLIIVMISQFVYLNYLKDTGIIPTVDEEGNRVISIAVIPFENRGGDQYFAAGITEDIINRLIIIKQFRVTNKRRTQEFAGSLLPIEDIAKRLNVALILTGSIAQQGDKIAVRAQLIDQDDTYLWGNTFQHTSQDIMAVQSEIAQRIADQLKIQLSESEKRQLHKKATTNPTAYDLYLRGRSLYYEYQSKSNDSAVVLFKQAIDLDPNYARAWAGLSDAYAQRYGRFVQAYFWTDSSLVAGKRAIELDSNLSEAYKALATAYDYREDYESGHPLLLKAVALDPTDDRAVGNLGTNYLLRGDLPTALRWQKKSAGLNPTNWIPYQLIGWIYRLLGDLENAEAWFKKSLAADKGSTRYDTYELLAYTLVSLDRNQEALDLIPKVLEIGNDTRVFETAGLIAHFAGDRVNAKKYFQQAIETNTMYREDHYTASPIGLGQLLLEEGDRVEAEVYLNHALENNLFEVNNGSKSFEPPFYLAAIYAIKGNRTKSLEWLHRAIEMHWVDYAKFYYGPYFRLYKSDPEFLSLINKVKENVQSMRKSISEN